MPVDRVGANGQQNYVELPIELVLYCDAVGGKFTLRVSGDTISHAFATSEDAILHAETLVDEETKLTLIDMAGRPLVITTVLPREK